MINRINLILQAMNITARQFAEEIGIQPSGMSHILSGRNNPSLDFVMKVINRYPEIDIEWLVFGKGAMYKHQNKVTDNTATIDSESILDKENHPQNQIIPNLFNSINDDDESPLNESKSSTLTELKPKEGIITSESSITSEEISSNKMSEQQKIEQMSPSIRSINNSSKRIVKLILLYSDNSFVEYHPD